MYWGKVIITFIIIFEDDSCSCDLFLLNSSPMISPGSDEIVMMNSVYKERFPKVHRYLISVYYIHVLSNKYRFFCMHNISDVILAVSCPVIIDSTLQG